jgi:predicted nucleic acid-binding protein
MKGVAESSPLHYLVQIRAEDVMRQLFVELITPPEVIAELTHPRAQDAVRSWAADPPSWLRVIPVRHGFDDLGLGPGESAAITLTLETHADTRLIDERAGTFTALRATSFRATDALMNGLLELDRERGGQPD